MGHSFAVVTRPAFHRVVVTDNFIKAVAVASKDLARIGPVTDVAKGSRACAIGSIVSCKVTFEIQEQVDYIASIGRTVEGN